MERKTAHNVADAAVESITIQAYQDITNMCHAAKAIIYAQENQQYLRAEFPDKSVVEFNLCPKIHVKA